MNEEIRTIFEPQIRDIPLDHLIGTRKVHGHDLSVGKCLAMISAIPMVGLVEPLAVHPAPQRPGFFYVLDGNVRMEALRELGQTSAPCMIATEADTFTYNEKISRLTPIQEHRMILRAIDLGVQPDAVATALCVNVKRVRASVTLLDGIHPEVVEKLKDRPICERALRLYKRVKPLRQLELADLMMSMDDFSIAYAKALILATPNPMLVHPEQRKLHRGPKPADAAQMAREMENLERELRNGQDSYGDNVLSLSVVQRFVRRLLEQPALEAFLASRYPEIAEELRQVAALESV